MGLTTLCVLSLLYSEVGLVGDVFILIPEPIQNSATQLLVLQDIGWSQKENCMLWRSQHKETNEIVSQQEKWKGVWTWLKQAMSWFHSMCKSILSYLSLGKESEASSISAICSISLNFRTIEQHLLWSRILSLSHTECFLSISVQAGAVITMADDLSGELSSYIKSASPLLYLLLSASEKWLLPQMSPHFSP